MNTAVLSAKQAGLDAVPAATRSQAIRMSFDEVIRVEKKSGVNSIEVMRGMVWLTSTPANGDVILQSGDRYELGTAWPFVLQALEDAELSLRSA